MANDLGHKIIAWEKENPHLVLDILYGKNRTLGCDLDNLWFPKASKYIIGRSYGSDNSAKQD